MISKVVSEAKLWNGYLEKKSNSQLWDYTANAGYNNYTIFAELYNKYFGENYQGQAWCAMYVSVVFRRVFGSTSDNVMKHFSYCPYGVNWFKSNNRFYKSPKVGDVIFFTNGSVACHTGIVVDVDSSKVYTMEGNTSSTSGMVDNGGCCRNKSYSLSYSKILGYGRPNYDNYTEYSISTYSAVGEVNVSETSYLNIRKEPNTSSESIGTLHKGDIVNIISKSGDWYGLASGYVFSQYINIIEEGVNLDMNKLQELETRLCSVESQLSGSNEEEYNWVTACPEWSIPYVQKAYDEGYIVGHEDGKLHLTNTKIWALVVSLRVNGIMD